MFIETEETPNPNTIKFIPGETVLEKGVAEFKRGDPVDSSPLAARLFSIDDVGSVFFGQDFISVSKAEKAEWNDLKAEIMKSLIDHFMSGDAVLLKTQEKKAEQGDVDPEDSQIVMQIKAILDQAIRPALAKDGGDVTFHGFEDGIVYLEMIGACSGCPSASMTLKMGIERALKHHIPEVTEVRPVQC